MTTTAPASVRAFVPTGSGLSFTGLLRSEWIKLRSVRSTIWSYATVVLISFGMALLMSVSIDFGDSPVPADAQATLLAQAATFGVFFGQLVVAVLGVLAISGEYSTGMIRSSLTATPRRLPMLAAKAVVLFVCTFVVGVITTVGSYLVAASVLGGKGISASLTDPDLLLPLLGGALYLALVAVFALGVGAILRSSAGGIAAALGIILLLPIVLPMIPAQWATDLMAWLPGVAGQELFFWGNSVLASPFEPWQALLIMLGSGGAVLGTAAVLLMRRDA